MTIGERIKKRRKELKLSVDALADRLGKNRATVYRYESDEIDNMPLSVLEPLASALHVSPAHLIGWEEPDTKLTGMPEHTLIATSRQVPLYGSIAAGVPLEMIEVIEYIEIPLNVALRYPKAFLLKVNGDSMNKIIPNGMYALIDPTDDIKNGDPVAVNVDGFEATLKRFYKLHNTIVLEPESYNPEHKPQIFDCTTSECEEIKVIGKMVWFMSPLDSKF